LTTHGSITHSPTAHKQYIQSQIAKLRTDVQTFRKVYQNAYISGKQNPAKKSLDLKEEAFVYWDALFSPPGRPWVSSSGRRTDWLKLWKQYLTEKYTLGVVAKDTWNAVFEFALRTLENDSIDFWSEDDAWNSNIDGFVRWYKEKGLEPPAGAGSGTMDLDG
jgi:DCN1-like protein 1/2